MYQSSLFDTNLLLSDSWLFKMPLHALSDDGVDGVDDSIGSGDVSLASMF
jgi:hypothetical protein